MNENESNIERSIICKKKISGINDIAFEESNKDLKKEINKLNGSKKDFECLDRAKQMKILNSEKKMIKADL